MTLLPKTWFCHNDSTNLRCVESLFISSVSQLSCDSYSTSLLYREATDALGWTALHHASFKGHLDCIKILLKNGANIQCKTNDNQTCLHLASEKGHTDVVKILLEKGANIQIKTNDEDTCLHLAIKHGHIYIVQILAQNKWLIAEKNKDKFSPLGLATKLNHIEVVNCLLQLGVEFEVQNRFLGDTPLHIAAENGFFEITDSLIASGANINSKSKKGILNYFVLIYH